ncbi:MAG: cell division protein ZipA [Pseudomonadales bacterium]|nr:cell division protein ZipA [Pseudomonadales bacterium]
MEFGLREVLIGVGLLVIAAILFDGFRRMRRSKVGSLDLPAEMGASMDDDWEYYRGELPNGGARSVSLRKEPVLDENDDEDLSSRHEPSFEEGESLYVDGDDRYAPQVSAKRVVREPDAFSDPGEIEQVEESYQSQVEEEYEAQAEDSFDSQVQDSYDNQVQDYVNESLGQQAERGSEGYEEIQTDLFADDEMLARAKEEQERQLAAHYRGPAEKPAEPKEKPPVAKKERKPSRKAPKREPAVERAPEQPSEEDMNLAVDDLADVIVINVMAKAGDEIYGEDLFKAMSSCGFHHGEMDIFHRFEQHNGHGRLLFSVANVVEPGTFDPKKVATFTTPGICMFLKLPGPVRPLQAFDVMLDSARRISKLIGADMKDENHSVMTQQTFEHYRQRVVEFERKQLSQRALAR